MKLKVGKLAPDFTLPDETGEKHRLSKYRGRYVLVYFYPNDDTPGCTKEACALRDNFPAFSKLKVKVLGISTNSVKSHYKFAKKYDLPFTLLADEERVVVRRYGVWGKKKFMGRTYDGTMRTSFLINPKGRIEKIYEKVKPALHAEEVLSDLKA